MRVSLVIKLARTWWTLPQVEFAHSTASDTIVMPGSVLVDIETAGACVDQFAQTLSRPTTVDWIEL